MRDTIRSSVLVALMAWLTPAAFAHNYLPATGAGGPTMIADISVSRAAYRELSTADQVDIYQFTARKGQELYIQMTVPLLDRLHDFAPAFVLAYVGDGQPVFEAPQVEQGVLVDPPHDVVDEVHPHGSEGEAEPSLVALQYDAKSPLVFDEPFTGTRYWIRQTITVRAPEDGTYRIGVYSPNGSTGKYVLAPGKRESFGLADLFSFASVRLSVRAFCEVPTWPDILVLGALGAAAVTGLGLGVYALLLL